MKAWTSLTDTSAVKTCREVPALRNNAFREFVVVVCAHRAALAFAVPPRVHPKTVPAYAR
jgi:hypothetical protein